MICEFFKDKNKIRKFKKIQSLPRVDDTLIIIVLNIKQKTKKNYTLIEKD